MAVKIETEVYIEGINRTSKVVQPVKFGDFLDERLDECNLSLRAIGKEVFSPLAPVEIHIKITEYFGTWGKSPRIGSTEENVYYYVVANDSATEFRPGSGLFNHELYLIELTKVSECVVVDALTYTNDIGRNYSDGALYAEPRWE